MKEHPFKIWKPLNPMPPSPFEKIDDKDSTESLDSSSNNEADFRSRLTSPSFTLQDFHTGLSGTLKRKAMDLAISKIHPSKKPHRQ
ncbi:hypothetical protein ARMGADRAFT_1086706 [Armillaria gallica]|uniref:Uncharacterized protein n=1 Tax=Armillaria gallica TaxID=47427 RepID=A0A2H3CT38_ARMGA|nr:hypothetical protein ARMGADRAFT_1086706 [Armillaria gallica]